MPRYINADALLKRTIHNPLHAPYITEQDVEEMPTVTINDHPDEIKVTNCNHNADDSKKDLISRADALSCFHDWIDQRGDVHTADEMPEYQRIEQLPSAQPEQIVARQIRWMEMKEKPGFRSYTPHCKCSNCGHELDFENINYCYFCGARFVAKENSDE